MYGVVLWYVRVETTSSAAALSVSKKILSFLLLYVCMYVRTYCTVGTIPAGQTARLTLSNIHLCAIRFLNLLQTNT